MKRRPAAASTKSGRLASRWPAPPIVHPPPPLLTELGAANVPLTAIVASAAAFAASALPAPSFERA